MEVVNRKVYGIAVALMAVAMLALPISAVMATKPEGIVFYGYPTTVGGGFPPGVFAGDSDNYFIVWEDFAWGFSMDYTAAPSGLPPGQPQWVVTPIDEFAVGDYDGRWILHGFPMPTSTNVRGIHTIDVTEWDGESATGYLVIQAVNEQWVILKGEINGMKVRGGGTVLSEIGLMLFKYEGTIHFDP